MRRQVQGIDFNYEEMGSGQPLLVLHGWPLDHRHMVDGLEPLFAERSGWRRIYPDFPGMGLTAASPRILSQDEMVALTIAFAEELIPDVSFAIAGTSYGGWVARAIAHEMPDRVDGLLLIVPAVPGGEDGPANPTHRLRRTDADFRGALQPGEEGALEMVVSESLMVLEEWRRSIFPSVALANHEFLQRIGEFSLSWNPDELERPLTAPVAIVTGRQDNVCGYEGAYALLRNYPDGTFAAIDGAGHCLPMEKAAVFRALASEWLDRVEEHAAKRPA